jgi:hypothetical protein
MCKLGKPADCFNDGDGIPGHFQLERIEWLSDQRISGGID